MITNLAMHKQELIKICPQLDEGSGIYVLTREDEEGFKYAYVGQAKHVLSRLAQHMSGFQHIDLSLKKHGFYARDNPCGWKVNFAHCPENDLDSEEQRLIKEYALRGFQLRNKTSGSQGKGKTKIADYRQAKTYRQGVEYGYRKASKEIAHLFDLHLNFSTRNEGSPSVNQQKAAEKFKSFLEYYKIKDGGVGS